ncbi:hypothetical protein LUZ60_000353 [Juncus effusus]|nr:hypothetical protein LUZ60_000353 [Juncus effusus]
MEEFRSRSYAGGRNMQIEVYSRAPLPPLRSYSTSYSTYEFEFVGDRVVNHNNKKKSNNNRSLSFKGWGLASDPEIQRKRRVAGYKAYEVEGKLKVSFRKSFRWIKNRYNQVIYGYS